jgi:hypothetical protein
MVRIRIRNRVRFRKSDLRIQFPIQEAIIIWIHRNRIQIQNADRRLAEKKPKNYKGLS